VPSGEAEVGLQDMSYWQNVAKQFFEADPKIRYVGIIDRSYHVVHSQNRPGVVSATSPDLERSFISIVPPIMLEGAEKLEEQCGPTKGLRIDYKKLVMAIHRAGEYTVVLTFDPTVEMPFANRISELVRRLMKTSD
jgi:hypothetical protein